MSDIKQLWESAWSDSLGDIDLAEARVGGRATKANPDKEDSRWWNATGPEWVEQYIKWRKNNSNWKIWVTPDGEPAIELGIIIKIADVDVKMVVDRVFEVDGQLVVVDLKTSPRTPSNTLQLGFYKIGLEKAYDVKIAYGN